MLCLGKNAFESAPCLQAFVGLYVGNEFAATSNISPNAGGDFTFTLDTIVRIAEGGQRVTLGTSLIIIGF